MTLNLESTAKEVEKPVLAYLRPVGWNAKCELIFGIVAVALGTLSATWLVLEAFALINPNAFRQYSGWMNGLTQSYDWTYTWKALAVPISAFFDLILLAGGLCCIRRNPQGASKWMLVYAAYYTILPCINLFAVYQRLDFAYSARPIDHNVLQHFTIELAGTLKQMLFPIAVAIIFWPRR